MQESIGRGKAPGAAARIPKCSEESENEQQTNFAPSRADLSVQIILSHNCHLSELTMRLVVLLVW